MVGYFLNAFSVLVSLVYFGFLVVLCDFGYIEVLLLKIIFLVGYVEEYKVCICFS